MARVSLLQASSVNEKRFWINFFFSDNHTVQACSLPANVLNYAIIVQTDLQTTF